MQPVFSGENFDMLMKDAMNRNGKVTLHVHHDGVYYEDRVQLDRLRNSANADEVQHRHEL